MIPHYNPNIMNTFITLYRNSPLIQRITCLALIAGILMSAFFFNLLGVIGFCIALWIYATQLLTEAEVEEARGRANEMADIIHSKDSGAFHWKYAPKSPSQK
jgi:hypothetical protein